MRCYVHRMKLQADCSEQLSLTVFQIKLTGIQQVYYSNTGPTRMPQLHSNRNQ